MTDAYSVHESWPLLELVEMFTGKGQTNADCVSEVQLIGKGYGQCKSADLVRLEDQALPLLARLAGE